MPAPNAQPVFKPFDPDGDVRVYVRSLPHWRQPGATYFVTFRQDDSIPSSVLAEWIETRDRWYRAHGLDLQWRKSDPQRFGTTYAAIPDGVRRAFERRQARMLHEELDRCHGSCILQHETPRNHVADALQFFHGQRLWLGDFIVMPNHVHAIAIPWDSWELEDLLGSIKKWSSRHIAAWLESQPETLRPQGPPHEKSRFWQHESYDHIVRDLDELVRFRKYIADNAVKAKLLPTQYCYGAADWLDSAIARARLQV